MTPATEPTVTIRGKRSPIVRDPFGYRWSFSQFPEVVTPEAMMKGCDRAVI